MSDAEDLISALRPIANAFRTLNIPYFVGGSVASSYHGVPRSTMDVDLVADLQESHVTPLFSAVFADYYANAQAIRSAVIQKRCFNLIHLDTSFKVDIFVSPDRKFDRAAFARATIVSLGRASSLFVSMATPEDMILAKLVWYQEGGEVSERQWNDVSGLMSILGSDADVTYMNEHAIGLGISNLLSRLIA